MQKTRFLHRSRGRLLPALRCQNLSRLKPQKVNFSSNLWASWVRLFSHSSRRLHRNWKLNIKACTFGNVFHWIIHSCSCENSSGEGKARQLWINSNDKFGLRTPQGQDGRRPTLAQLFFRVSTHLRCRDIRLSNLWKLASAQLFKEEIYIYIQMFRLCEETIVKIVNRTSSWDA